MTRRAIVNAGVVAILPLVAWAAVVRPSFLPAIGHPADQDSAVESATQHAKLLAGWDAENAAATLKALRDDATGDWAEQLDARPKAVVAALVKTKAKSEGHVASFAVAERDVDREIVLVAASARNEASSRKTGEARVFHFVLTLVRDEDAWRVSKVEVAS